MEALKETKEVFKFIFNIVEGIKQAESDGAFTITDIPAFFNALVSAPAAIKDANKMLSELVAATDDQKKELYAWIADSFNINNDKIEMYVESVFIHIVGIVTTTAIAFKKDVVPV